MKWPFYRERIAGVYQFMSENPKTKERVPHIYVITNKRVVELNYDHPRDIDKGVTVATLKQLKAAKKPEQEQP